MRTALLQLLMVVSTFAGMACFAFAAWLLSGGSFVAGAMTMGMGLLLLRAGVELARVVGFLLRSET